MQTIAELLERVRTHGDTLHDIVPSILLEPYAKAERSENVWVLVNRNSKWYAIAIETGANPNQAYKRLLQTVRDGGVQFDGNDI